MDSIIRCIAITLNGIALLHNVEWYCSDKEVLLISKSEKLLLCCDYRPIDPACKPSGVLPCPFYGRQWLSGISEYKCTSLLLPNSTNFTDVNHYIVCNTSTQRYESLHVQKVWHVSPQEETKYTTIRSYIFLIVLLILCLLDKMTQSCQDLVNQNIFNARRIAPCNGIIQNTLMLFINILTAGYKSLNLFVNFTM